MIFAALVLRAQTPGGIGTPPNCATGWCVLVCHGSNACPTADLHWVMAPTNCTLTLGTPGQMTCTATQGATGPQGPSGSAGPQGPAGSPGVCPGCPTSSTGTSSITAAITTVVSANDTIAFTCANLPPTLPGCPPSVTIPAGTVLTPGDPWQFQLSYTGELIIDAPGDYGTNGNPFPTLTVASTTWGWALNSPPPIGGYLLASVEVSGSGTAWYAPVTQLWTGYPALPVINVICTVCGGTVSNGPGVVTVRYP